MNEQEKLMTRLTEIAMKTLDISRKAATLRILALHKSGLIDNLGPPDGQTFQMGVDIAMKIPQLANENE